MERWNKVAQVTLAFWVLKIFATTLGETSGDFISMTMGLGYSTGLAITAVFFAVVLAAQLKVDRFHPALYWAVIVGTTTVGTEISDLMDRTLHLGYIAGSTILGFCLLTTLYAWYRCEHGMRVYPIRERREEMFYWAAILFSNSLGTAFGDMLSDTFGLGYVNGALITAGIIAVVVALHYATRINELLLFWIAFVFTRPFGATFGDFLTKPIAQGGLAFSTLMASLVVLALMTALVGYRVMRTRQQQQNAA